MSDEQFKKTGRGPSVFADGTWCRGVWMPPRLLLTRDTRTPWAVALNFAVYWVPPFFFQNKRGEATGPRVELTIVPKNDEWTVRKIKAIGERNGIESFMAFNGTQSVVDIFPLVDLSDAIFDIKLGQATYKRANGTLALKNYAHYVARLDLLE